MQPCRAGQRYVAFGGVRRRRANGHRIRAARRLTVCLILVVSGVGVGGPAPAATYTPSFTVYPRETTQAQFTQLDVMVSGTWVNTQVVVMMGTTEITSGSTDGAGNYDSGAVPVPANVVTCGQDEVDWYSAGDFITKTAVAVYCPTVQVTPNQLDSAGGPASFTVTGAGYPPARVVDLTLDNSQSPFDGNFSTDGTGAFTKSTSVQALPCGTHQLTAASLPALIPKRIRAGTNSVVAWPPLPASTTLTVTGCTPPPSRYAPKITANPAVITDGTLTHVTGSGFLPDQPITLVWETLAGATISTCSPNALSASPLVASQNGGIDTYCLARPHDVLGAVQIAAVLAPINNLGAVGLPAAPRQVAAPVVVEGGSMQPSSGDQLIFRR